MMLRFLAFLAVHIAIHGSNAHVIPRQNQLSPEAKEALEGAGVDTNKPYVKPKQKVEQILAVGDSYTAGIGSNGRTSRLGSTKCSRYDGAWPKLLAARQDWPYVNDGKTPDLTFGACSGNVMVNLREDQLKQGEPVDITQNDFTPIGKPQLAVLTISGNDAKFSSIINDCVFRFPTKGMLSCDQRLGEVEGIVKSAEFKKEVMATYSAVIKAGRDAGGANPPEAFQAYVGGYVGLFNHDDPACDKFYWNILRWGITYREYLTTKKRLRFNQLVDTLNGVLESAANELKDFGVFYVGGYNDGFNKRRFCEPREDNCIHDSDSQDSDFDTAFWSYRGQEEWQHGGSEGKPLAQICKTIENGNDDDPNPSDPLPPDEVTDLLGEILVPNEEDRKKLSFELGPWNITEGWDEYDDIFEAIRDRGQNDPEKAEDMQDYLYRMFHPKQSGYVHFSNKFMDTIKANREDPKAGGTETPSGDCHVTVRQDQSLFAGGSTTYKWRGTIVDGQDKEIEGCSNEGVITQDDGEYELKCDSLGGSVKAAPGDGDKINYSFKDQTWTFPDPTRCDAGGWDQDPAAGAFREIKCRFQCT